ncbi:MAG: ATP-binding protein [Oscillospiraceae bacterium]|nr:ATP-binding protein [Oscillospiraceae bacterium]
MTDELARAKEAAEQNSRYQSDFLARMSHEIRTPMNAIIGITELALREKNHDARTEHILTIKQAGAALLALVNDILDFSDIGSGKTEIVTKDYSLASLIDSMVSIIRMRTTDLPIRFTVNADSSLPKILHGDDTHIRQAVLNILSNAVKYTEEGFVCFTVSGEKTGADGNILLRFEVEDSGIGIKPEDIDKLFASFSQFDLERCRASEGIGLGLAITHSIVKAMGGDITVNSQYGRGSVFTVALGQKALSDEPLAKVENPQEKSVLVFERREKYARSIYCTITGLGVDCKPVNTGTALYESMEANEYAFLFISYALYKRNAQTIRKFARNTKIVILCEFGEAVPDKSLSILAMPAYSTGIADILNGAGALADNGQNPAAFCAPDAKILIVDDIHTNLIVAQGLLAPFNMRITVATGGAAAIEALRHTRFDLIFMDHKMPVMDGVEATLRIRGMGEDDPYYKYVPIIALTANTGPGVKNMFLENGFSDFLSKPIEIKDLYTVLARWLPEEKRIAAQQPEPRENARVFPEIEGLDTAKGLAAAGGKPELYTETLRAFYIDVSEKRGKIEKAFVSGDIALYTTYAHGFKSAAAIIGAEALSGAARELEAAGKRGDRVYIAENHGAFITLLSDACKCVGDALGSSGDDRGASDNIPKADLRELLKAIEEMDANGINRLAEKLGAHMRGAEDLLDSILVGDFESAGAAVRLLLEE